MDTGRNHTPEIVISKVVSLVDDEGYEFKSKAGYISIVQKAIEELAITTYYQEAWKDFEFPDNLILEMPSDSFNLRNIYIFQGPVCDIGRSQKLWWKRNYYTQGGGYIANDKWTNNDPFIASHSSYPYVHQAPLMDRSTMYSPNDLYFYNIQNGQIMFSSSCKNLGGRVMLHYNSLGCEFGEAPLIPSIFRTAIEDYVCEFVLRERMARDQKSFSGLWKVYENRLNNPMNGSWKEAEMRAKKMNASQRGDMAVYLSRGNWGRNR